MLNHSQIIVVRAKNNRHVALQKQVWSLKLKKKPSFVLRLYTRVQGVTTPTQKPGRVTTNVIFSRIFPFCLSFLRGQPGAVISHISRSLEGPSAHLMHMG